IRLLSKPTVRPVTNVLGAFPMLEQAQVRVEELDALGGPQGATTPLYYDPSVYLPGGFGDINPGNTGDAWAVLKPAPTAAVPGAARGREHPEDHDQAQRRHGGDHCGLERQAGLLHRARQAVHVLRGGTAAAPDAEADRDPRRADVVRRHRRTARREPDVPGDDH